MNPILLLVCLVLATHTVFAIPESSSNCVSQMSPLRESFTQEAFDTSKKNGDGKWTFINSKVSVYSWSFGNPGKLTFEKEVTTGALQATMKNGGYAASGYQGIAYVGVSSTYFVRLYKDEIQLLDQISLKPNILAKSSVVNIEPNDYYTLRLCVQAGKRVTVLLNGYEILTYNTTDNMKGRMTLVAANGSYGFDYVSYQFGLGNADKPERDRPLKAGTPVEFRGHRYLVVLGKVTWHEAKKACEARGGYLVILNDSTENEFVRKLCKQRNLWIGLTEEAKYGEWRWVDGSLMTFTDFKGAEPNNQNGREHYAHFCFNGDGFFSNGWNDLSDDGEGFIRGYICEWDK